MLGGEMRRACIHASLAALLFLGGAPQASAEDGAGDTTREALASLTGGALGKGARAKQKKRWDYSRFSNGPRRVPRARGASLSRAQALGIGGVKMTKRLLRGPAPAELLEAVPGEPPRRLLWPVIGGRWGRGFGYTRKVRKDLRHNGVDVGAPRGAVVRAAADGLVVYSDNTLRGLGNAVLVLHPGGWTTLYAHNLRNTVQPGWRVKRGERIALVGSTGIARGPHLHFEWRDNGRLGDPARLFVGRKSDELTGPLVELAPVGTGATAATREAAPPAGASGSHAGAGSATDDGAHTDAASSGSASGAVAGPESAEPRREPDADSDPVPGLELGSVTAARALLDGRVVELDEQVAGRRFSNLLWPVKGGQLSREHGEGGHRGVDIAAEPGAGVRVAADGIVVYAGEGLPGLGHAVLVLHREGWVTLYGGNREISVRAGQRVLRGEWIARVGQSAADGEPHLHFEWLAAGQRRDPLPRLLRPATP
jgi:murein DD-endopeptidase MepM/ murein hydrolase activator NlpD